MACVDVQNATKKKYSEILGKWGKVHDLDTNYFAIKSMQSFKKIII